MAFLLRLLDRMALGGKLLSLFYHVRVGLWKLRQARLFRLPFLPTLYIILRALSVQPGGMSLATLEIWSWLLLCTVSSRMMRDARCFFLHVQLGLVASKVAWATRLLFVFAYFAILRRVRGCASSLILPWVV